MFMRLTNRMKLLLLVTGMDVKYREWEAVDSSARNLNYSYDHS